MNGNAPIPRLRAWGIAALWLLFTLAVAPVAYPVWHYLRDHLPRHGFALLLWPVVVVLLALLLFRMWRRARREAHPTWRLAGYFILSVFAVAIIFQESSMLARAHLLLYGVLAVLVLRAVRLDAGGPLAWTITFLICISGGVLD